MFISQIANSPSNFFHLFLFFHESKSRNKISFFLYERSPVEFVTSGGGSKAWAGKFKPTSDKMEFLYDGQGFLSMHLTAAEANFAFYDVAGTVLHTWSSHRVAAVTRHRVQVDH
jgi:hypothetical protein